MTFLGFVIAHSWLILGSDYQRFWYRCIILAREIKIYDLFWIRLLLWRIFHCHISFQALLGHHWCRQVPIYPFKVHFELDFVILNFIIPLRWGSIRSLYHNGKLCLVAFHIVVLLEHMCFFIRWEIKIYLAIGVSMYAFGFILFYRASSFWLNVHISNLGMLNRIPLIWY